MACGARTGEPNVNPVGGTPTTTAVPSWTSAAPPAGTNTASAVTGGTLAGVGETIPGATTPAGSTAPFTANSSFDSSPRAVLDGIDASPSAGFAACTSLATPVGVYNDAEANQRMLGRWVLCGGGQPLFAQEHDGLEFREDGTWAFLRYDGSGDLQPQRGFDGGGQWTAYSDDLDATGYILMSVRLPLVMSPMEVLLMENPAAIQTNSAGRVAYVAVGEVNADEWPAPVGIDAGASEVDASDTTATTGSTCGQPGDVIPTKSLDAVLEHLMGRWRYCSGFEAFAVRHDGIEFNEDRTWAFLQSDAAGELQPMLAADSRGTWEPNSSEANGEGLYQIDLSASSGGGNGAFFAFQDGPTAMRIATTGGLTDYVAAE